jgi:hypothetical protein
MYGVNENDFIYCECRRGLGSWSELLDSDTARDYTLQFTITHYCPQSRLHQPLLGSGCQRQRSPSSGFPNYPRPQSQRLNLSSLLTHSPTSLKVKIKVTLRRAVYRHSALLGAKPLETHDQVFFFFLRRRPTWLWGIPLLTAAAVPPFLPGKRSVR